MTIAQAVEAGDVAALGALVQDGKAVNAVGEDRGRLPLVAARHGDVALLSLLVENCPSVALDEPDEQGRDVLHHAALSGDVRTIAYAVERLGFDPLRGDAQGITPFDLAHEAGSEAEAYFAQRLGTEYNRMYRNPVRRGFYADPSIVRVGEDYYMVNSSFVYFPCIPISHSRDLVHWQTIGHAITNPEWAGLLGLEGGFGYWAPDISYDGGRFWICATLRCDGENQPARRQILTWSERPEGPYVQPVMVDMNGIDPSLFRDADGRRYMLTNLGAKAVEISEDGRRLTEPRLLYFGDTKHKSEGPHILRKDGWYYLIQAEGGTEDGHQVSVARAKAFWGPYTPSPYNPVMRQNDPRGYLQRCGHAKLVDTPAGDWYAVYLCGRKVDGMTVTGRETALDPVQWTPDGWPIINGLKGPSVLQKCPDLPVHTFPPAENPLDFEDVRNGWIAPRWTATAFARLDKGRLCLRPGAQIHTTGKVSVLLQRQNEADFDIAATMETAIAQGTEAGVTGYYDEKSFYAFGVRRETEGLYAVLRVRTGETEHTASCTVVSGDAITFHVEAKGLTRRFSLAEDGGDYRQVCLLENVTYLADEGLPGKRFTGAMHGLYAIGKETETKEAVFTRYETHYPARAR